MSISTHVARPTLSRALDDFQNALSLEEKPVFNAHATKPDANSVLTFTSELDHKRASNGRWCISSRLNDFLEAVRLFSGVVDSFVQSNPNIAALVWGSVKFTLLVVVNVSSYFEKLSKVIMDLRNNYPRFNDYHTLFPDAPRLQAALSEYFAITVNFCQKVVEIYRRTGLKQTIIAALWKPFEAEINGFKASIERQNNEVQQEIRYAAEEAASRERADQKSFRSQIRKFQDRSRMSNQELLKPKRIKENQKLLDKFTSSYRYVSAFKRAKKSRLGETCSWLIKSKEFQSWLQGTSSPILTCLGKMGCGKTVLCGFVIDYLFLSNPSSSNLSEARNITYFFCQQQDAMSLNSRTIMGCLIKQLLSPESMPPETVQKLHDMLEDNYADVVELGDFFIDLVRAKPCVIVLDGLDECEQSDWTAILRILRKLSDTDCNTFKIFITGQHAFSNELRHWFKDLQKMSMDRSETENDISTYVELVLREKLSENKLKIQGEEILLEIQQTLCEKADGMFLWVHFQIEEICRQTSNHLIRETLMSLPKSLSETYQRVLDKIRHNGYSDLVIREFFWITAAKRELSLNEINEALSIDISKDNLSKERLTSDPRQLISVCAGLLSLDEENQTLHFTHSSVLQFLVSNSMPQPSPEWRFTSVQASTIVDKSCIAYLNFPEHGRQLTKHGNKTKIDLPKIANAALTVNSDRMAFRLSNKFNALRNKSEPRASFELLSSMKSVQGTAYSAEQVIDYPFLRYAREYWLFHCTKFVDDNTKEWRQWQKLLFGDRNLAPLPWTIDDLRHARSQVLGWIVEYDHVALAAYLCICIWKKTYPPEWSQMLERAAAKGYFDLSKILLKDLGYVLPHFLPSTYKPLQIAAREGHSDIISLILSVNGNTDNPTSDGETGLLVALRNGHVRAAQRLVHTRSVLDGYTRNSISEAFDLAVSEGYSSVVQEFMAVTKDSNAMINIWDLDCETALSLAVEKGDLDIVRGLIDAGFDVNDCSVKRLPLHIAVEKGDLNIVRELLAVGADVDIIDSHCGTALQAAAAQGNLNIVKELLGAAANPNILIGTGLGTAIAVAAAGNHLEIVRELLDAGANVNLGEGYTTALHVAVARGHSNIVRELLFEGTNVNLFDATYRVPLYIAAERGYFQIVQKLLAAGALINVGTLYEWTPFHIAVKQGHLNVVQELLSAGAGINNQTWHMETGLHIAANQGHLNIVQELISEGADIGSKNSNKETGLHIAANQGHLNIVQELISAGADIDSRNWKNQTVLHIAVKQGHLNIVQELLSAGADIDSKNSNHETGLHMAVRRGQLNIIKELLSAGADTNIKNRIQDTGLHIAANQGHLNIVQELLFAGADIDSKDWDNQTGLQIAKALGHVDIVQLLTAAARSKATDSQRTDEEV